MQFVRLGEGPPVLAVHGTPGGYDQGEAMGRFLVRAGFEAIAVSRPGYLETPLSEGPTIDDQADALAALLDQLGLERAGVLCWSGGGPSSYRLAVRHPERVCALVALAAVSKAIERPKENAADRLMFTTRAGDWLLRAMALHAPKQLISSTLAAEGTLSKAELEARTKEVFADDEKREFVLALDATVSQRPPRKAGLDNDWDRFAAIESLELERIQAPCLLVHGSADSDVPPEHSEHAAAAIPGAESLVLDGGTHLAFFTHPEAEAAQARAIELLSG